MQSFQLESESRLFWTNYLLARDDVLLVMIIWLEGILERRKIVNCCNPHAHIPFENRWLNLHRRNLFASQQSQQKKEGDCFEEETLKDMFCRSSNRAGEREKNNNYITIIIIYHTLHESCVFFVNWPASSPHFSNLNFIFFGCCCYNQRAQKCV